MSVCTGQLQSFMHHALHSLHQQAQHRAFIDYEMKNKELTTLKVFTATKTTLPGKSIIPTMTNTASATYLDQS